MGRSFTSRLFVLDTESTGIDPLADRIVEIAGVYFEGRRYLGHHQMLIDPERPIPKEATDVHGISNDDVRGKPRFADVALRFLQHVTGAAKDGEPPVLVGYNAVAYDVPLLNAELERAALPDRVDASRVVDPMIFVRFHLRGLRSRKLGDLAAHYRVGLENAHRASADARATGEVLLAMVEEGLIPDDVDGALARQAELRALVDAEFEEFGYWLYRDRESGDLRIGAGKHCGAKLAEVDPGYLAYLTTTITDLPAEVRRQFEALAIPAPRFGSRR